MGRRTGLPIGGGNDPAGPDFVRTRFRLETSSALALFNWVSRCAGNNCENASGHGERGVSTCGTFRVNTKLPNAWLADAVLW